MSLSSAWLLLLTWNCVFYWFTLCACSGRRITSSGQRDLDQVAGRVLVTHWEFYCQAENISARRIVVTQLKSSIPGGNVSLPIINFAVVLTSWIWCICNPTISSFSVKVLVERKNFWHIYECCLCSWDASTDIAIYWMVLNLCRSMDGNFFGVIHCHAHSGAFIIELRLYKVDSLSSSALHNYDKLWWLIWPPVSGKCWTVQLSMYL